jgi:FdhE protein
VSLATARRPSLADAARSRAEWRPWLAVLDSVAEAAGDRAWRLAVPEAPAPPDADAPLLRAATLTPDARLVRRWARRLLETAAAAGGAAAALAAAGRADDAALAELLDSGLAQDAGRISALAIRLGVEPEALAAVAALAPAPLLRACAERWRDRLPAAWPHGYCPLCGAWPSLAEARGLERARRLRCGRCAADWGIEWLRCVYCGMDDHTQLGGLVSGERAQVTVDTCGACRGYLKTVNTLGATPADEIGLLDLATVELDVAALEQGYRRPAGPGAPLDAHVRPRPRGLLGGWPR